MRFSYVDDVGVLGISKNVAESAAVIQKEVDDILEWVNNNVVSFDIEKLEVI